jgi:Glycosyltransferases involved in cell wall biogenesis
MKELQLSFIVPIFNGKRYLSKCLDSLLNQNISTDEYEIICINDCSTDNSTDTVLKYKEKHSNIILINLPVNSKTGTVCNVGLANARGKYIWIVGQDDWIETGCLKKLIQTCEQKELDILTFNYKRVDEQEKELHSATVFNNSEVMKGNFFIHEYFENSFIHYLLGYEWRAIFNKSYLEKTSIKFTDGAIYEDTVFLFKAMVYANRLASIEDFLYYYRVNTGSITDFNKKYKGNLIYEFAFVAGKEVLELSEELKNKEKEFSEALYHKAIWYFESFSYKVIASSFKEKKVFYSLILKNKKSIANMIDKTTWYINLLANPYVGFVCVVILKPFYLLKKRIKNKPQQDWCY